MPSEPGLEGMHAEMLMLLKVFHQICMENDIKYSLHAGTLLGAIRDKGFIPWDDDVDVMLMRSEYDRLLEILECQGKKYKVSVQRMKKAPCLVPTWRSEMPVWLDIHACDYISERPLMQKCKIGFLMMLTAMIHTRQSIVNTSTAEHSRIKQAGFYAAYYLGRLFPYKQKIKLFDWVGENAFCGNKTMIHRSNDIYSGMRPVYPKSMMSEYLFTEFEGTEVMITKRYHEVLVSLYGEDYMTPKRMTNIHMNAHASLRERCGNQKS